MPEPLLHPNAEVVRTGLPQGASVASTTTLELVAGPFAPYSPSSSPIPPGAYIPARQPPAPEPKSTSVVSVSVEEEDELRYVMGPPVPDSRLEGVRGGKRPKKAVLWEVIRSLRLPSPPGPDGEPGDEGDLPLLSQSLPHARQNLTQIRHSHHQLAQMLATGTKQEECSHLIGYSPAYITTLKGDPAFRDLVAYYATQREHIFVDAIERMRSLGLNTIEELQARLEEDPSQFTNRELMEQVELMLVKPMSATRGIIPIGGSRANDASGSGVSVNVNFIQTQSREPAPSQPDVIDMKPIRVP